MHWSISEYKEKWTTRDFLKASLPHLKGDVLDYGGGTQKYRSIIESAQSVTSYKAFDVAEIPGVDFVGDVHQSGLETARFDTVVCTQVLEHTERPWEVVKEIARICKAQGTVILSVPFLIGYHPCPNDFYRFSFQGVEALCQDDFELVQAWTYGGLDQILRSSDEFSTEYSYEKFLKIDTTRKKSMASSLKKKFWKLAYKIIGARQIPSIYSNVGCILKRK
ncbi:MAG: methyltransferase domain-containing protein [Patescibacteria group bacterium]|nr:methyltransferase domain-containing protein [Patescibacteria group bacterium]